MVSRIFFRGLGVGLGVHGSCEVLVQGTHSYSYHMVLNIRNEYTVEKEKQLKLEKVGKG